ncbi:MAG: MerR family DNA-binding transcriptional regulator [Pseudonocardiaceae bacterium]
MNGTGGQTWKVGQLARLTGLTVRTLHHYDTVGLLRPSRGISCAAEATGRNGGRGAGDRPSALR